MSKKYTRREALKYGGKVGVGAIFGGFVGKGYKTVKDHVWNILPEYAKRSINEDYRNSTSPGDFEKTIDYVKDQKEKIDKTKGKFKEKWDSLTGKERGISEEELLDEAAEEKESRRSFLLRLIGSAHKHPVGAGATAGALYVGLKGLPKYFNKDKIAKIKDQNIDYKEKVDSLEKYTEKLEEELKDYKSKSKKEINEIKDELDLLRKIKNNEDDEGGLERKLDQGINNVVFIFGILGLISSFSFYSMNMTGAVIGNSFSYSQILGVILFLFSFILILIGFKLDNRK
jgi:hypothetical protein